VPLRNPLARLILSRGTSRQASVPMAVNCRERSAQWMAGMATTMYCGVCGVIPASITIEIGDRL